jgi:hypothetical protein
LSWFAAGYVNLFRAVPLVMVLLWFFLIIPHLLESLLGFPRGSDMRLGSAITGFALFEAAYYSEIIRAGIQSVSKGQMAAASALGMTYGQSMRLVVLAGLRFGAGRLLRRRLQGGGSRRAAGRVAAVRRRHLFRDLLCRLAACAPLPEEAQDGLMPLGIWIPGDRR